MDTNLIKEALMFGFQATKKKILFLIGLIIIILVITLIFNTISSLISSGIKTGYNIYLLIAVGIFFTVLNMIIQVIINLGNVNIALKLAASQPVTYKDIFVQPKKIVKYAIASTLSSIVEILVILATLSPFFVGAILLKNPPTMAWGMILMFPALTYLALILRFYFYLILDKNLGPISALKESVRMTHGIKIKLFMWAIILTLIAVGGIIFFGVGLLFTIPWVFIADAYLYRKLSGSVATAAPVANQTPNVQAPTPPPAPEPPLVVPSPSTN